MANGTRHMRQVGQHRIRKIANFKKAYGGKTEFEWCLEQHKHDRDYPKACGTGSSNTTRTCSRLQPICASMIHMLVCIDPRADTRCAAGCKCKGKAHMTVH